MRRKAGSLLLWEAHMKDESRISLARVFDSRVLLWALLVVFGVVIIRSAWVMDDAYITFRTSRNLVEGYGLTWNIAERVQAFTNPLWMFCMSGMYLLTRDVYYSSIFLSVTLSLVTVYILVFRIADPPYNSSLATAVLISSKAFVDYSTSGLENPLTHFLLVLFCLEVLRQELSERSIFCQVLIASLAATNRLDTFLIFIPVIIVSCRRFHDRHRAPSKLARLVALGLLPLVAWELFSVVYYGFLFPNTAYAKLLTGADSNQSIQQGMSYLLDSLERDPITLITVIGTCVAVLIVREDSRKVALALGVVSYVIYIVAIGGDYMSGRFLSAPLLACAVMLSTYPFRKPQSSGLFVVVLIIGVLSPASPLLSGSDYSDYESPSSGVGDERGAFYQQTGLLRKNQWLQLPTGPGVDEGIRVQKSYEPDTILSRGGLGLFGYYCGPKHHIIDSMGLTDAFLARIPTMAELPRGSGWKWRIGHASRPIPEGYQDTVRLNRNMMPNRNYAEFYEKLAAIIKGDVFSLDRFREILNMNLGRYDHLLKSTGAAATTSDQQ
jgi:arabinofuranosyltransferase